MFLPKTYYFDAIAVVGAVCVSANDMMIFWYTMGVYIVFKLILVSLRNVEINREVDYKVEAKLLEMAEAARLQLARGDHRLITFHRQS